MATLKKEVVDLKSVLTHKDRTYQLKLDGWRHTIALASPTLSTSQLFLDGADVSALACLEEVGVSGGRSSLVFTIGGAFMDGRPILVDDLLTFRTGPNWTPDKFAGIMVKEYFVQDRPGPDKTLTDELPRPIQRPGNRPGGPLRPRPTERPAGGDRGRFRKVER